MESVAELRSGLGTFLITRAEQLAALNAELARSNDELDAFAYVAAHDLKEPLRGIANFATFMVEDYEDALDDEGRERLATILRLSQRMGSLLDSLLEYSRIGRAELDLTRLHARRGGRRGARPDRRPCRARGRDRVADGAITRCGATACGCARRS